MKEESAQEKELRKAKFWLWLDCRQIGIHLGAVQQRRSPPKPGLGTCA